MAFVLDKQLFPYPPSCDPSDFSDDVKSALREEARKCRHSHHPMCMYPECPCDPPFDKLEYHHIQAQRYQGPGTDKNGILLCAHHHSLADRRILSPEHCLALKRGENPFAAYENQSIDDLISRLRSLSEFSFQPHNLSPYEKWKVLASILHAASIKKNVNRLLCVKLPAWAFSEIAAMLTSHIPSRKTDEAEQNHPRQLIKEYVNHSRKFNAFANDAFLVLRNRDIIAVNKSALLQPIESEQSLRDLYSEYKSGNPPSFIPVNHMQYRAYIFRQWVSVLSKLGDPSSLTLANMARIMAERLRGRIPEADVNEARARFLMAAVLVGNERTANAVADNIIATSASEKGIKKVVTLKTLIGWSVFRGHQSDTETFLRSAMREAIAYDLHHQFAKLQALEQIAADLHVQRSNKILLLSQLRAAL